MAVTFTDTQGATACAKAMHGRWFDGRQIEVEMRGSLGDMDLGRLLLPLDPTSDAPGAEVPHQPPEAQPVSEPKDDAEADLFALLNSV